ncbi:unnamed protein product [Leptidea sinapis]|uniref:Uncharacterized protein n=1 Tax=Leptidea sinapis TaxID=189913 RepID=A0A5E4QQ89_9NEOP|nr:unnamed protein product [Leptidea sinapis]
MDCIDEVSTCLATADSLPTTLNLYLSKKYLQLCGGGAENITTYHQGDEERISDIPRISNDVFTVLH